MRGDCEEGNGLRLSSGAQEEEIEAEVRLRDKGGRVSGARVCELFPCPCGRLSGERGRFEEGRTLSL